MEEDFFYIELFELYKGLFTEKQRDMFYQHYYLDLSYKEIAEMSGSARQSVFDAVKIVKDKLNEYESELHLKEKNDKLVEIAKNLDGETAKKIKEIIGL